MYEFKLCLGLFVIFIACNKIIAEDVEVKEEESAFPNISDAVLGLIKKTEEHLQEIFKKAQDRAAEIQSELKANLEKVLQKINEIKNLAKESDEKECVTNSIQDIVEAVASVYKSPPKDAKSIRIAVQETKMKFASIKDTLIKTDLKEAKSKFDGCMNQESEENCQTVLEETMKAIKEKAEEEVEKEYGHAKGEIENSLEVVNKWLKKHEIDVLEKTGEIIKQAETCIKLVHEKKDEL